MYQAKHIPIRTCVGCGKKRPQKDFIKIIRTKEKSIVLKLNNPSLLYLGYIFVLLHTFSINFFELIFSVTENPIFFTTLLFKASLKLLLLTTSI